MPIKLTGLSYRYDRSPALHGIDMILPDGSLTVLCGVTGSGKSTLLRLLAGLEEPSGGCIQYIPDGIPSSVSIVFQQPENQLFAGTVLKDVEYGLEQRGVPQPLRGERAAGALEQAGLPAAQFGERSPFLLSGGEKRRVCIAGAIAPLPSLLVLDEPTAGLDPAAAQGLLETIRDLKQNGYTVVVASHDFDYFFPAADQIAVLAEGSLRYTGPASGLWDTPRVLEDAGLEPPAYIRIGRMLMGRGLLGGLPASPAELPASLDPRSLAYTGSAGSFPGAEPASPGGGDMPAAAPAAAGGASPGEDARAGGDGRSPADAQTSAPDAPEPGGPHQGGSGRAAERGERSRPAGSALRALDPRVKWLAMALWSVVILGIREALPMSLATLLIAALLAAGGIAWSRAVWFYRPFLPMFLLLWLLSAFSWQGTGPVFAPEGALTGGLSVLRLTLLLSLGFLFTETTSGAPLREGLEWAISPLGRLGVRTRNWSLAVSVTLQFVPWVLGKISALHLALASRGNRRRGLARWTPKQISLMAVPLMLQVIGMGDELSTAIEARGYDPEKPRTPWFRLEWTRRDTAALLFVLVTAALLYGL